MEFTIYTYQQLQLMAQERLKIARMLQDDNEDEVVVDFTLGLDDESRVTLAQELARLNDEIYYGIPTARGWNWNLFDASLPVSAPAYKLIRNKV